MFCFSSIGIMSGNDKQTYYRQCWEDPKEYPMFAPWISKGKDTKHFTCKVCRNGSLALSNMGIQALRSHMKPSKVGKPKTKHEKCMETWNKTRMISFTKPSESSTSTSTSTITKPQSGVVVPTSVPLYVTNESVKAEIRLAMKCVTSHYSQRSMDEFPELLRTIFPDSEIAKGVQLGRTKIGYTINYGLKMYYQEKCMNAIKNVNRFTVCFDEAHNDISNRKQLDAHVLYFDEFERKVQRSYVGSTFMGHGHSDLCLKKLQEALHDLNITDNLVQVSMDGPNVNWKLLSLLSEERKNENPSCPDMLNIGSCGIHVLHGAYGTGQNSTCWELDKLLKNLYSIFRRSPARRSDYLQANDLHDSHEGRDTGYLFPLKFCGHRWLENSKAINRLLEIVPKVKTYFAWLEDNKKFTKSMKEDKRFIRIKTCLASPLLDAILHFSLSVINDVEPLLLMFQAEKPLSVLLYEKLKVLVSSLLQRVCRPEVLENTMAKIMKLDLSSEANLLPESSVGIGFGAKNTIRQVKSTMQALEIRKFRTSAKRMIVEMLKKNFERSPLKYPLTLYLSSLSPFQINTVEDKLLIRRFEKLLESLVAAGWITSTSADGAATQYKQFIDDDNVIASMKSFTTEERIDDLYMTLLENLKFPDLEDVVKIVLIMSHGNARVESGFSINEQILLPNLKEQSLVAQRMVYEGVRKEGGVLKADITPKMLKHFKESWRYAEADAKENRKRQTDGDKRREDRKRLGKEIKEVKSAKKLALDSASKAASVYDAKLHELTEKLRK